MHYALADRAACRLYRVEWTATLPAREALGTLEARHRRALPERTALATWMRPPGGSQRKSTAPGVPPRSRRVRFPHIPCWKEGTQCPDYEESRPAAAALPLGLGDRGGSGRSWVPPR